MSDRDEFEALFPSRNKWLGSRYDHAMDQARWEAFQAGKKAARRWSPIEEAPRDSARGFIACRKGQPNSAMHVIAVDGDLLTMAGMTAYRDATHWMPLPEPPNE